MEVRLTSDRKTIEQSLQQDHAQRQSDLEVHARVSPLLWMTQLYVESVGSAAEGRERQEHARQEAQNVPSALGQAGFKQSHGPCSHAFPLSSHLMGT